jgi:hypothetical protein
MKKFFLLTSVAVFTLVGSAWASIPDSGGVIHGCYKPSDGKLHVIDTEAGHSR